LGKTTDHERGHPGAEVHAKLEESVIYPAICNEIYDEKVMDEALEENHVAHVLLNELKRMKGNDRYEAKFKVQTQGGRSLRSGLKKGEAYAEVVSGLSCHFPYRRGARIWRHRF